MSTTQVHKGVHWKDMRLVKQYRPASFLDLKMKMLIFLTTHTSVALSFIPTKMPEIDALSLSHRSHAYETQSLSSSNLYRLTTGFWDNFIYPNNVVQLLSVNSTLFSEDVVGRVDDSRTFHGRELNTEYVFGSFATLGSTSSIVSVLGIPISP